MMGDLVLLESEAERVIDKLQEGGIEQTAVHHHLLHESPRVLYTHIVGHGAPAKLAASVRAALALTKTPLAAPSASPSAAVAVTALHSHMLGEMPRLFFMHFWGNDDALHLARALRTALDKMNVKKA